MRVDRIIARSSSRDARLRRSRRRIGNIPSDSAVSPYVPARQDTNVGASRWHRHGALASAAASAPGLGAGPARSRVPRP